MTATGAVCLVLHAHLPFVNHPDHVDFLEEDWLFEAVTDTYLPLVLLLRRLEKDGIPTRLALGVTPPLLAMLKTPALLDKCDLWIEKKVRLTKKEIERRRDDPDTSAAAVHYEARFREVQEVWRAIDRDLPGEFGRLQSTGRIEILSSAATHGFLPLIREKKALRAQIEIGAHAHEALFGHRPAGFWLPECAWKPGLGEALAGAGVRWVVLDTHGVQSATPRPAAGTFRPIEIHGGLHAFGRDPECSEQVWSNLNGYPGDPAYRELYRDLGYDADYAYIRPFLKSDGVRRNLGIKYHRVTGRVNLDEKDWWNPEQARQRAAIHAGNFIFNRGEQVRHHGERIGEAAVITAPFDAELFGHWWYEGPWFIEELFRQAAAAGSSLAFRFATPTDVLDAGGSSPRVKAHHSTWGRNGFSEVWLNEKNQWFWPYLHEMESRMTRLAGHHATPTRTAKRLLDQMARELLLAQSSDWLFIVTMETSAWYAEKRFRDHVHRFFALETALEKGEFDEEDLRRVERHDSIFPDLDYRVFA